MFFSQSNEDDLFRAILIGYRYSPMTDLIRDQQTHVIGLKGIKRRLEQMEQAIIQYFISRNEDQLILPPPLPPRRSNRRPSRRHRRIRTRQRFLPGLVIPGGGIY